MVKKPSTSLNTRAQSPEPCLVRVVRDEAGSQENNEDMASFVQEDEGMSPCFSEAAQGSLSWGFLGCRLDIGLSLSP